MSGPRGRTLLVTNDFAPRRGGIESFMQTLCGCFDPDDLVVYTASMAGSEDTDRAAAYEVLRDPSRVLLPTPAVARRVAAVVEQRGCGTVVFGAAAPLGLLGAAVRRAGASRVVAITHGHEVWWARLPGSRAVLRRIAAQCDVLTYVSEFCRAEIARALPAAAALSMRRLAPAVDTQRFVPGDSTTAVVLSASRLVRRKGHDRLVAAWPRVLAQHPVAQLVIVGSGPQRRRLARQITAACLERSVHLRPGVPWAEMPAVYRTADVFALPCRTRKGGLEPEALGIVFLEAAAAGLPVLVGRSGGAPESLIDGVTGHLVDPRSTDDIAGRLIDLLDHPEHSRELGARGRAWVHDRYGPAQFRSALSAALGRPLATHEEDRDR